MEYTLSNGTLTLGFTTLGGTFTSIKDPEGRERLWQPDPAVWMGQAPICFPVCGGLRDGKATTLSGKQVALARHGFARKQEFQLVLHGDRDITFALESTPTLLEQYPFPFHFESRYALEGPTVRVTYATTNTGSEPMPFFIGGHPAFRVPVLPGERYEDYRVVFEKDESRTVPTPEVDTGLIDVEHRLEAPQHGRVLAITHELFNPAETIYDTLESRDPRERRRLARRPSDVPQVPLPHRLEQAGRRLRRRRALGWPLHLLGRGRRARAQARLPRGSAR